MTRKQALSQFQSELKMIVRVVCAWCGCHMGIKKFEGKNVTGPCVSHGICPECIPEAMAGMQVSRVQSLTDADGLAYVRLCYV
jgi:hypothetical protein